MGLAGNAAALEACHSVFCHHSHSILIGWTSLARVVRGPSFPGEEDFVTATRLDGASNRRIISITCCCLHQPHHRSVTLAIPSMILSETSLSFLDWACATGGELGVLLQDAQISARLLRPPGC